jgi:hypothetical protein
MSGYAQLMKMGAMTKKGKKETSAQNLVRELLTDHGVQSPGASQVPAVVTADVAVTSPEIQVAINRKVILRDSQKVSCCCSPRVGDSPTHSSKRDINLG